MQDEILVVVPAAKIRREAHPSGRVLLEVPKGTRLRLIERKPRYSRVQLDDGHQLMEGLVANVMLGNPRGTAEDGSAGIGLLHCPICQGTEWKETTIHTNGALYLGNVLRDHYVQARVCLQCGHVDLYVNQRVLDELAALR